MEVAVADGGAEVFRGALPLDDEAAADPHVPHVELQHVEVCSHLPKRVDEGSIPRVHLQPLIVLATHLQLLVSLPVVLVLTDAVSIASTHATATVAS